MPGERINMFYSSTSLRLKTLFSVTRRKIQYLPTSLRELSVLAGNCGSKVRSLGGILNRASKLIILDRVDCLPTSPIGCETLVLQS